VVKELLKYIILYAQNNRSDLMGEPIHTAANTVLRAVKISSMVASSPSWTGESKHIYWPKCHIKQFGRLATAKTDTRWEKEKGSGHSLI
jgi:hypothetical protein